MLVPNTFTSSVVTHHRTIFVISVCRSHRSDCVFCRYIETLTPILTNLHPSHIVDQLHDKVSSDVQDQNKIKKQQAKQVRFKQGTVGSVGCKGFLLLMIWGTVALYHIVLWTEKSNHHTHHNLGMMKYMYPSLGGQFHCWDNRCPFGGLGTYLLKSWKCTEQSQYYSITSSWRCCLN